MPSRRKYNARNTHERLIGRVDDLVLEQIEQVVLSDYSDKSKMSFIVDIMERRNESVEHLTMMFEEAARPTRCM